MRRIPPQCTESPAPLPPNLSFVLGLSPSVMTLGLANMRGLMAALGDPQERFQSIVVAGTNGKGSVTAFLSSILRANGRRTGSYTSPHVYSVCERISVEGEPVSLEAMEEAASRIVPLYEKIRFSYFEALTAIAFQVFAERGMELAVLEVGLGGRFDATNIVDPKVSILTGVSLDHRRILGDSEEEILREKLGVTRPGVPFVCGRLSAPLRSLVERRALRDKIPLYPFERIGEVELREMSFDGMRARLTTETKDYGEIRIPFVGEHQMANALVAIRAAELVLGRVERLHEAAGAAALPGRFEATRIGAKTAVLDVAHNDEALVATLKTLAALSPREENGIILGVMRRKELRELQRELPPRVRRVYFVEPVEEEAYTAPELLAVFDVKNMRDAGLDVSLERFFTSEGRRERFLDRVFSPSNPSSVILLTGSHRTVEVFGRQVASMVPPPDPSGDRQIEVPATPGSKREGA